MNDKSNSVGNRKVQQLDDLYREIQTDGFYRNDQMGSVFVPGVGSTASPLVLVGEAPGREEEILRRPFVGAAGQNLSKLLLGVGWSREQTFITNLLKYRPLTAQGGNRKPSVREARYALPYLLRELRILGPRVVVCLGSSAAAMLLEDPHLKMARANGQFFAAQGMEILVTYHPSPFNHNHPARKQALEAAFARLGPLAIGNENLP
jgi:uracil-DNA glycosylase